MGQSPSSKNYTNNPNDWILIQGNADIENYRVKPRVWTTEITKIAEIGDIILSVRAPVGDVAKTDYKAVLGRGVASIRGNDFIFQLLGKMKSFGFWETLSTGSTFDSINSDVLKNATIFIPSETEQQAIGEFFKQLDDTIAFHQRTQKKYQNLKKSYLEKIFAKINYAWKQRQVKYLCEISTGKSNTQDKVDNGTYPFYVRSATIETSHRYLFDEEAVLTVGDGVGTGKVFHYVNGKYDLHQRVYRIFNFSSEISGKYFYYYFSVNFYHRVMMMTAKTSVDSVRLDMIADMEISYPIIEEQLKIVQFFEELDDTIAFHQRELEKYQQLKQVLLDQLFV